MEILVECKTNCFGSEICDTTSYSSIEKSPKSSEFQTPHLKPEHIYYLSFFKKIIILKILKIRK